MRAPTIAEAGRDGVPPAAGGPARLRVPRYLTLLLAAAVVLPLLILGFGAWLAWRTTWREAANELSRSADAAAEYTLRVLAAHAVAAGRVNDLVRGLPDAEIRAREAELHAALRALVAEVPEASASYVIDREGVPLLGATLYPVPRIATAADREFFLALQRPDAPLVHVSRIFASRFDEVLFFAVSRRRTHTGNGLAPDAFDGVVNLSLYPNQVGAGLGRLRGGPADVLVLVRADGQMLARSTPLGALPPPVPPSSRFHAEAAAGSAAALYPSRSPSDGTPHLTAIRAVEGLGLYATANRPRAAILARWCEAVATQLAIGVPATLALLCLALLVRRGQGALLTANAALERRAAEGGARAAAFADALDLTATFVGRLDDGRIRYWSRGCERLYGFSAAQAVGQFAARLLRTEFPAGGRDAVLAALRDHGEWRGELRQRHRDGARLVTAAHWILRPGAPGEPDTWVEAHTDVTALHRAERALAHSEAHLRRAQEAGGVVAFAVGPDGIAEAPDAFRALYNIPPGARVDYAAILAAIHPEDRSAVEADNRRLAQEGGPFAAEFRVLRPDGTVRWLLARGDAEPGRGGAPGRITGVNLDVTERRQAEAELRESEARLRLAQRAAGIGIYDWHADGTLLWDARVRELWGLDPDEPAVFADYLAGVVPEDRPAAKAAVQGALDPAGEGTYAAEYRVRRRDTGELIWIAANGQAHFAGGRAVRLVGTVRDVTVRKAAEARSELLMREVDHRAKNALAVVQAALRLTRADDPATFVRAVQGRVAALARAQTALARRRWSGADLRALLEGELAPFLATGSPDVPRARLDGPPVLLGAVAAQPLSMTLHELATNALKYGALSAPGGEVAVSWTVAAGGALSLTWRETGGPTVAAPPGRRGFGTRVIEQTVVSQLRGQVVTTWPAEGMVCTLTVPLAAAASRPDAAE